MEELKKKVRAKYHEMKQEADNLPLHGPEDHEIRLTEGSTPLFARNYRSMSAQELEAVKKYLDKQLAKGFILSGESHVRYM